MHHNPRRYKVGQKITLIGFVIPTGETVSLFDIFMYYVNKTLTVDETRFYFKEIVVTDAVTYDELGEEVGFAATVVDDELVAHNRYPEYTRTNDPFLHVRLNNMWVLRNADTKGEKVGEYQDDMLDIKLALSFMEEMATPELVELAELINTVKPQ